MASEILPPRTPLVNADGTVTPEWYRYFVARKTQLDDMPSDVEAALLGLSNLRTAPMPGLDDAPMPPPAMQAEVADPLTPPVIIIQADDLLYPPRYGA